MLKISVKLIILSLVAHIFLLAARGWDDVGHKTTAYIAWQQMTPQARERASKLLQSAPEDSDLSVFFMGDARPRAVRELEHFMIASTWADIVRDRKFKNRFEKYHKSNWHYDDTFWRSTENGQISIVENVEAEGGVAIPKIAEFVKLLQDASAPDEEKAIGLAWILHLVGDIHQPLHTSARVTETEPKGDQGGNLFLLTRPGTPREQQENLHWFWDSIIVRNIERGQSCDTDFVPQIAKMITKRHSAAKMQNRLKLGEYREWQQEGVRLAQTEVFSADLKRFETPSEKYRKKAFRLSQEQLALAGYRMGATLNQIFGNQMTAQNDDKIEKEIEETGSTIGEGANDAWIWFKTRAALLKESNMRESDITVHVDNRVVTLRGTVLNLKQKSEAEQLAKKIEGVTAVKNQLKIITKKNK
jgi:osmotically-inducible protein OsmY